MRLNNRIKFCHEDPKALSFYCLLCLGLWLFIVSGLSHFEFVDRAGKGLPVGGCSAEIGKHFLWTGSIRHIQPVPIGYVGVS